MTGSAAGNEAASSQLSAHAGLWCEQKCKRIIMRKKSDIKPKEKCAGKKGDKEKGQKAGPEEANDWIDVVGFQRFSNGHAEVTSRASFD